MNLQLPPNIKVTGKLNSSTVKILTPKAMTFLQELHKHFNQTRLDCLQARIKRQQQIEQGHQLDFLKETESIRQSDWQIAPVPEDLQNRRVEITGPVERKMMINALNSGANVFMADFEDSLSPTFENVMAGIVNCCDAIRKDLTFSQADGKQYQLNPNSATLVARPRGWHLEEKHFLIDNEAISASLFDFGLYYYHNAHACLDNNTGPYFYLPKMESYLEARLWHEVFVFAEDYLSLPRSTIRATVLIETIHAALQMDEILYELKEHITGLNAGRWDYIFSIIKTLSSDNNTILPDRAQVTMTVPFMRAYTQLLIKTCHRRGAHAMGGMAAFVPSRKDETVNAIAITKVREDKQREVKDGCDGTWVAHPDLVPIALHEFDKVLGNKPHQIDVKREDVNVSAKQLTDIKVPNGTVTQAGIQNNINVALQYITAWLQGFGCVAIYNLMEDAATAEISRSQLWQWLHHHVSIENNEVFTKEKYHKFKQDELNKLQNLPAEQLSLAVDLLDNLVLNKEFKPFLTIPAYELLP